MTNLLLSFQYGCFISFCCLTTVARTFNTMWNRIGENGHSCLVAKFRGTVNSEKFQLFTVEYDASCGFVINDLYYFDICSIYISFFKRVFTMNVYCILSNASSLSVEMIVMFFTSFSLNIVYQIDWFTDIEQFVCSWNKCHLIILNP